MKCKLGEIVDITMGQSPKSIYYTQTNHNARFCRNTAFGYLADHFQAGVIVGGTTHLWTDAFHSLHVMGDDFGTGFYHLVNKLFASLEIGNQYFR